MAENRSAPRARGIPVATLSFMLWCAALPAPAQQLREFDSDYLQAPPNGPELAEAVDEIVRLTNAFREEEGLDELTMDERLTRTARYFAAFMARTNEYGHQADGNQPWERAHLFGYDYCMVAENIAYQFKSTGFETAELAAAFVEGWKESPPHRENMLQPHMTETGVAVGHDPEKNRYYAVQLFGRPRSAAIEFQITNRTPDAIKYAVEAIDGNQSSRRTFELPPRATMFHTRCRPVRLDWGWSENADDIQPQSGRKYVVTLSASGHRVTEQPASESNESTTK